MKMVGGISTPFMVTISYHLCVFLRFGKKSGKGIALPALVVPPAL